LPQLIAATARTATNDMIEIFFILLVLMMIFFYT